MRVVLLLVAAVIAIVAGVAALKLSGGSQPEPTQVDTQNQKKSPTTNVSTVDVLVARERILVGTIIKPEMLSRQPWPSHLVLESFIVSDGRDADVVGRVARATFMPYEPLLKTRLGNPNDPSFLAATLPEGMRAVTVATDVISGVAGYVFPGDRVDLLVTHNVPGEIEAQEKKTMAVGGTKPAYTEVLVPNVLVLAVNLREPEGIDPSRVASTAPTSMTLEVPEEIAQRVKLAEKLGSLSVALRSIKDIDEDNMPNPTSIDDLTRASAKRAGSSVNIIRGVEKDEDYKSRTTVESMRSLFGGAQGGGE